MRWLFVALFVFLSCSVKRFSCSSESGLPPFLAIKSRRDFSICWTAFSLFNSICCNSFSFPSARISIRDCCKARSLARIASESSFCDFVVAFMVLSSTPASFLASSKAFFALSTAFCFSLTTDISLPSRRALSKAVFASEYAFWASLRFSVTLIIVLPVESSTARLLATISSFSSLIMGAVFRYASMRIFFFSSGVYSLRVV